MSENKKVILASEDPPPGMHVARKWTERECVDGKIHIKTFIVFCCPMTDPPLLISDEETEEKCT